MTDRPSLFGFAICASGATIIALGLLSRMVGLDPDTWTIGGLGLLVLLLIPAGHWRGMFRAEREREAIDLAEKATRARLLAFQVEERERALATIPTPTPALSWRDAAEAGFRAGDGAGTFAIRALSETLGWHKAIEFCKFYASDDGDRALAKNGPRNEYGWNMGVDLIAVLVRLRAGDFPLPQSDPPEGVFPVIGRNVAPARNGGAVVARAVVDG